MPKGKQITCCFICSSDRFVDEHHYDCCRGAISPETVPLCRRCHRTYHDWGIGAFSPDTTERALKVFNKLREILRSLPLGHPSHRNFPPMKLEDVKRSGYWYKKWGIKPPRKERVKAAFSSKIPNPPALCGDDWLKEHLHDHTPEEIGALTIEVACGERRLPPVSVSDKRGKIKVMIKEVSNVEVQC
ncbi:MAG: hypothetical protein KKD44_27395 [Proteobacteria bacterium]|nr:hypothetical protein [Pseudomonadota bacterium]